MPTLIAIDVSLSMCQHLNSSNIVSISRLQVAKLCVSQIQKYFSRNLKLEHISVVTFSSEVDSISGFTRDFTVAEKSLENISTKDKSDIQALIFHINNVVLLEWGTMEPCNIIVITDGRFILPDTKEKCCELFEFPCNLHFLCLNTIENIRANKCEDCLQRIIDRNNGNGNICCLVQSGKTEKDISSVVKQTLHKYLNDNFSLFETTLRCGDLKNKITLFPSPLLLRAETKSFNDEFNVIGFLNISEVGNPPVISRHILLPVDEETESKKSETIATVPSFSVMLHGSLKIENKLALVRVGPNWYGIIHSWADSKTKSNLVLSLFASGDNAVPWIGNIEQLGPISMVPSNLLNNKKGVPDLPSFPVQPKKFSKRSYSQPTVTWTRATGLQTDVQKILRSSKKLPEKSQVFYKDLNRLRRAALAFGFHDLLEGISALLERECTLLPGTTHPEATLQLSHAAKELKASINLGYDHMLEPLKTNFAR